MRGDVAPVYTGLNPVRHPTSSTRGQTGIKAPTYEAGDCRFESCRVRQMQRSNPSPESLHRGTAVRAVVFIALAGR